MASGWRTGAADGNRPEGALPEVQLDYMFLGRQGEDHTICALHAVGVELIYRVLVQADKGPLFACGSCRMCLPDRVRQDTRGSQVRQ